MGYDARRKMIPPEELRNRLAQLTARIGDRRLTLMEVCGTHTHALGRSGIRAALAPAVRLVSGPGCPVCVTAGGYLAAAVAAARRGWHVLTFGDLLRVPGPSGTLSEARQAGAKVTAVYSPLDALRLARESPREKFVFLAVGFETTAPGIAAAVRSAAAAGLTNLKFLAGLKTVPPALVALLEPGELKLDGLLAPGHVSAIIGIAPYLPVAHRYRLPCVIAGFSPAELLVALEGLVALALAGRPEVINAYPAAVRTDGNPVARALVAEVFAPIAAVWRGLETIPASGLGLRERYREFALAAAEPDLDPPAPATEPPGCRCGEVLTGKLLPPECPHFGRECTPAHPVGPCMVSAEGSCAAYGAEGAGGG